jgi:hypothetical protein
MIYGAQPLCRTFIKGCLIEAILIPHMDRFMPPAKVSLNTKKNDKMLHMFGYHDLHGASMNTVVNQTTTKSIARMGKC